LNKVINGSGSNLPTPLWGDAALDALFLPGAIRVVRHVIIHGTGNKPAHPITRPTPSFGREFVSLKAAPRAS